MFTLFVVIANVFMTIGRSWARDLAPARFVIEGTSVTLQCSDVSLVPDVIVWTFHKNGTVYDYDDGDGDDRAVTFIRNSAEIYPTFDTPSNRTKMEGEEFTINAIDHSEEGEYRCEEIFLEDGVLINGPIYPVHVYVSPQEPKLTLLANSTLTEYEPALVARCTSQGGKPASKLTWINGTKPTPGPGAVITVNAAKHYTSDSNADLLIASPARHDHNDTFACIIEHPTYKKPKILSFSVSDIHSPYNVTIWANVTSNVVYCEASGYHEPNYRWKIRSRSTIHTGSAIYLPYLSDYSDEDVIECVADNGFPPNVKLNITLDELGFSSGNVKLVHSYITIALLLASASAYEITLY